MAYTWQIINRSDWPLWAIKPIAFWIMKEAKVPSNYTMLLRSTKRVNGWKAYATKFSCSITYTRRDLSWQHKRKHGIKERIVWPRDQLDGYGDNQVMHSRLDMLIHLMAHEVYHAIGLRQEAKGIWAERDCNDFAIEIVRVFRANWKSYWLPKLRQEYAKEYERIRKPTAQEKLESELSHNRKLLQMWENKVTRAQRKVKKYRATLRRYEGRLAALRYK